MSKTENDSKGFVIIFLVLLIFVFAYGAYFFLTFKDAQ